MNQVNRRRWSLLLGLLRKATDCHYSMTKNKMVIEQWVLCFHLQFVKTCFNAKMPLGSIMISWLKNWKKHSPEYSRLQWACNVTATVHGTHQVDLRHPLLIDHISVPCPLLKVHKGLHSLSSHYQGATVWLYRLKYSVQSRATATNTTCAGMLIK